MFKLHTFQNIFRRQTLLTLVVCILLCMTGFFLACHSRGSTLTWTAIDVNSQFQQGDAHLLEINKQDFILIDTGHALYAQKLLQFLKDRNITRLNAVIISHGHRDHYGGLVFLLRNDIRVDAVYFNPPDAELIKQELWGCSESEIEEIKQELSKRNIPLIAMTDRTQWDFGPDISMKVLYIYDGLKTPVGRTDINDTSAIIMLTHGNLNYLFTGDLNRPVGTYITEHNDVVSLKADVLKVPHHGTEGLPNNDFFNTVNPKAMVVPAPKALWFSDRSARVRKLSKDCPAYINGLHGHITIKSDGHSFRIETQFSPKAAEPPGHYETQVNNLLSTFENIEHSTLNTEHRTEEKSPNEQQKPFTIGSG